MDRIRIKLGDLVSEAPFGREWLRNNPWMIGESMGLVVEIIDFESVIVCWSTGEHAGTLTMMDTDYLEKINEDR